MTTVLKLRKAVLLEQYQISFKTLRFSFYAEFHNVSIIRLVWFGLFVHGISVWSIFKCLILFKTIFSMFHCIFCTFYLFIINYFHKVIWYRIQIIIHSQLWDFLLLFLSNNDYLFTLSKTVSRNSYPVLMIFKQVYLTHWLDRNRHDHSKSGWI